MAPVQPWQRFVGTDQLNYMVARGRPRVAYIPEVIVNEKHSMLTRVRARNNGITIPDPGGTVVDRDAILAPWYGQLGTQWYPGTPYSKEGPTKDQVGPKVPYSQLTEYNAASTNNTNITTPVTFYRQIIHGRLKLSGNGSIQAEDCVFDGPIDPANAVFTGETAIIDGDAAAGAVSNIKDCAIYMRVPHPAFNGHKGSKAVLERCHIFWITDGIGPYTKPGTNETNKVPTNFKALGCRIEKLVYWPGNYFANRAPAYWNGTSYQSSSSGAYTRAANGTTLDRAGYFDPVHADGNHNDCCEIHNAFGSHTWNSTTKRFDGNGVYLLGNSMIADDAYGEGNPSALLIPVPFLGYGDNPKRGLIAGGQLPGMARPQTSWNKPVSAGNYAANGVSLYVGQVTNVQFENATSVALQGNFMHGGNMGFQEQKKSLAYIAFQMIDNHFGPDYYMWSADNTRDIYVARFNDYDTANAMPNFSSGPVRIANHPATGAPPFGPGGNNVWVNASKWGYADGTPVGLGSSTVAGMRVI